MRYTLNAALTGSALWTSTLIVQGFQRINVSIRPGLSLVQDPVNSTFSGVVTLQRKLQNDDGGEDIWRDVQRWSIVASDGLDGAIETVPTMSPDPETSSYRLGIDVGDYYAGAAFGRLGTS